MIYRDKKWLLVMYLFYTAILIAGTYVFGKQALSGRPLYYLILLLLWLGVAKNIWILEKRRRGK